MIILGIESSCDETAAAVVTDGHVILSSVVSSQVALHHPYGGVVPELASRKHIEAIVPVVEEAVRDAHLHLSQVQAVAVTQGPGLIGSLLVGFTFAKGLAYALEIPWVGIDHLEGHIQSLFLSSAPPPFPFVVLLASGGHTGLYHVESHTDFTLMGQTRDDAAGEAYDKVAKMLDLGYPGGAIIDQLAAQGNGDSIRFPRSYLDKSAFDFSFSGLKSAVNRYIHTHPETYRHQINDIAAGFQEAVVEVLCYKLIQAAKEKNCAHIAIAGGVAANRRLRERIQELSTKEALSAHIPSPNLCGDNAAMIAAAGYHHLKAGRQAAFSADVYSRSASR